MAAPHDATGYVRQPKQLIGGHAVEFHGGGDLFDALLAAFTAAERFIHLEFYIYHSDTTGHAVAEALLAAVARGVEVRLIYDAAGVVGVGHSALDRMRAGGVELLEFHPLWPWQRGWGWHRLRRRDHRKLVVVDGRVGFAGGANIGDFYLGRADAGAAWNDLFVCFEGPAVRELGKLFLRTWNRESRRPLPPRAYLPVPAAAGAVDLAVLSNRLFGGRRAIRNAYLHAIRRARQRICIANAYFLPDRGVRRALRQAAARGVEVQLMLPQTSDIAVVQAASRHLWGAYLRWGVQVLLWPHGVLHAKIGAVDDLWAIVGSFNFDHRSLSYNLEVAVAVADGTAASALAARFDADAEQCEALDAEVWRRRPWPWRVVEWACFQLRALL